MLSAIQHYKFSKQFLIKIVDASPFDILSTSSGRSAQSEVVSNLYYFQTPSSRAQSRDESE